MNAIELVDSYSRRAIYCIGHTINYLIFTSSLLSALWIGLLFYEAIIGGPLRLILFLFLLSLGCFCLTGTTLLAIYCALYQSHRCGVVGIARDAMRLPETMFQGLLEHSEPPIEQL